MPVLLKNLVVTDLLNILCLCFLLYLVSRNMLMSRLRTRSYQATIILTILTIAAEITTTLLDAAWPLLPGVNMAANIVGFTASALLPYLLAMSYDEALLRPWLFLAPTVNAALCLSSPATGWICSVTADSRYVRGPLFPVYLGVLALGFLLLLLANCRQAARFVWSDWLYLGLLYLIFLAGVILQILVPSIHSSWHCATICLVLFYIFQRELHFRYDLLTGVFNRAAFQHQQERAARQDQVLLLFDLDDFKGINDTYGHAVGDRCLVAAAQILRECFQNVGNCYRIGGDEFVVLGPQTDTGVLERDLQLVMGRVEEERSRLPQLPRISYGYAVYRSGSGQTLAETFAAADQNMYEYKASTGSSRERGHHFPD